MFNPTTHAFAEFPVPTAKRPPRLSRPGPTATSGSPSTSANKIGMINPTTHTINEFPMPTANASPDGITAGPDGNLWFTEYEPTRSG